MHNKFATSDVYDEFEEKFSSLAIQLNSYGGITEFNGTIETIECYEDNALLKDVIRSSGEGRVLVVDGGGSVDAELLGGSMAQQMLDNGWSGIILNGVVRDRRELSEIPLGVKAIGSNPRKSSKNGTGKVGITLDVGGVVFTPGAMLYADLDGVLVERTA